MKKSMLASFAFIVAVSAVLNGLVFAGIHPILHILQVPESIYPLMYEYVWVIFFGIGFVFLYNFFAYLLRALGNSVVPLWFLGIATVLNIVLDVLFVVRWDMGVGGAAAATVIAQALSGAGIAIYTWVKEPELHPGKREMSIDRKTGAEVVRNSFAACIQQSVMNFGILMVQGLVNSFGAVVMAAFAAGVKIDTLAYMPAQEFGNAFSLFISQNYGAGKRERVRRGMRDALWISMLFCIVISVAVFAGAGPLIRLFVSNPSAGIIKTGVGYLRTEGAFYCGIGILFLLYGYYRGINRPGMSLVLTVISLGTRVLLAYCLAPLPAVGVQGIWWAIPIGWLLADVTGILCMKRNVKTEMQE